MIGSTKFDRAVALVTIKGLVERDFLMCDGATLWITREGQLALTGAAETIGRVSQALMSRPYVQVRR